MGQKFSRKTNKNELVKEPPESYQYAPIRKNLSNEIYIKNELVQNSQENVEKDKLDKFTDKLPELYTMKGKKKWCRVVEVYDGDTITILYFTDTECKGESLRKEKLRLYGIDTPELKPLKTTENREQVIEKAKEARDFLSNLILHKTIYIVFTEEEKYGRRMGHLYLTSNTYEKSINDLMIEKGYAKAYFGGKKE